MTRAEVIRRRQILVTETARGPILIGEQTLLALIRVALDSVPGLRSRRLDLATTDSRGSRDDAVPGRDAATAPPPGTAPAVQRITCRVAVGRDVAIPIASAMARGRVLAVLAQHLSLEPGVVEIIVEDLYDR